MYSLYKNSGFIFTYLVYICILHSLILDCSWWCFEEETVEVKISSLKSQTAFNWHAHYDNNVTVITSKSISQTWDGLRKNCFDESVIANDAYAYLAGVSVACRISKSIAWLKHTNGFKDLKIFTTFMLFRRLMPYLVEFCYI